MIVLFLTFLNILPTWAATFTFTDAVVDISQLTQGSLPYGGTTDTCKKLIIRNSQVYRIATDGVYQNWWKGQLDSSINIKNISTFGKFDFGVSPSEMTEIFAYEQQGSIKISITEFNANFSELSTTIQTYLLSLSADYIFATNENYFICYSTIAILNSFYPLLIVNKADMSKNKSISVQKTFSKIVVTPDCKKIMVWSSQTKIQVFRVPDLVTIGLYNPSVLPTIDVTSKITFSHDSSLAIIETDQINPLVVLDMVTYRPVVQIAINQSIKEAYFLDSSNSVLVVLGAQSIIIVDLSNNNSQYQVPSMSGVIFDSDQNNNIVSCYNNTVSQQFIRFTRNQKSSSTINENQFYTSYNLSNPEINALEGLKDTLSITSQATNFFYSFATFTPITIYFLGFINYLSLSSLYVLLNFPIPEHVFKCLVFTYQQVNTNFFGLLGVSIDVPMVSTEKVNSRRALFFEISSDVLSANADGCIFLALNIFAIVIFQKTCNAVLKKGNIIRRLINQEKTDMIYGQIINILTPLTLPWIFLFLKGGTMDMKTKINTVCYSLLFLVSFNFPILYLYRLLSDRKNELMKSCKAAAFHQSKMIKSDVSRTVNLKKQNFYPKHKQLSIQFHPKETKLNNSLEKAKTFNQKDYVQAYIIKKRLRFFKNWIKNQINGYTPLNHQKYNLWQLLTAQIVQQWYLCEANCLLPALVLFSEPAYFLVPIFFFLALGIAINFKKKEHRLNCLIMSLYPFLFHLSFMIFYWCSSNEIVVITEIFCLLIYFIGSVHHIIFMLYEIIRFFYHSIKKCAILGRLTLLHLCLTNLTKKSKLNITQPLQEMKQQKIKFLRQKLFVERLKKLQN